MTSTLSAGANALGLPEQRSPRIAFLMAGFALAAWTPLVPFAKLR